MGTKYKKLLERMSFYDPFHQPNRLYIQTFFEFKILSHSLWVYESPLSSVAEEIAAAGTTTISSSSWKTKHLILLISY